MLAATLGLIQQMLHQLPVQLACWPKVVDILAVPRLHQEALQHRQLEIQNFLVVTVVHTPAEAHVLAEAELQALAVQEVQVAQPVLSLLILTVLQVAVAVLVQVLLEVLVQMETIPPQVKTVAPVAHLMVVRLEPVVQIMQMVELVAIPLYIQVVAVVVAVVVVVAVALILEAPAELEQFGNKHQIVH